MRFSSVALAATAATLTVVAAPAAHADVKIVSKNAVTGASGAMAQRMGSGNSTTTTYYKAAKVRTDNGGGGVTIYDAATDKLYTLNGDTKTYTVASVRAAQDAVNPAMAMMDITTKAHVAPGGKTKMIMGKPATNYVWTATMAMKMKARAMPKNSGANGLGAAPAQTPMMTLSMRGEQWTTGAVKLPARSGATSTSALMANLGSRMPGMKPLMTEMSKIKGVPLQSTMTQSFSGMAMPGAPQTPITITTQAVSVSEAPLPDSLFRVPAGYKLVKNATPEAMGGVRRPGLGGAMGRP